MKTTITGLDANNRTSSFNFKILNIIEDLDSFLPYGQLLIRLDSIDKVFYPYYKFEIKVSGNDTIKIKAIVISATINADIEGSKEYLINWIYDAEFLTEMNTDSYNGSISEIISKIIGDNFKSKIIQDTKNRTNFALSESKLSCLYYLQHLASIDGNKYFMFVDRFNRFHFHTLKYTFQSKIENMSAFLGEEIVNDTIPYSPTIRDYYTAYFDFNAGKYVINKFEPPYGKNVAEDTKINNPKKPKTIIETHRVDKFYPTNSFENISDLFFESYFAKSVSLRGQAIDYFNKDLVVSSKVIAGTKTKYRNEFIIKKIEYKLQPLETAMLPAKIELIQGFHSK